MSAAQIILTERHKPASFPPDLVTMYWLLSSLMLVIIPHIIRLPFWYMGIFLIAAVMRISQLKHQRKAIPGWIKLLITLLALFGVLMEYGTLLSRQANIALLCIMLALKIMETNKRRDIYLLISMAYFVVITQFLFDQSFYMVAYQLSVVVIITTTLIVIEQQPARQLSLTHDPVSQGKGSLLKSSGKMLVYGIPLTFAMFVLFPRLNTPLWGLPQDALSGKTGISDEMEPGKILELFIDDSPAFRVEFEGPIPPQSQLYWRGPVLWDFDGRKWTRPRPIGFFARVDESRVTNPLNYTVTMEPTQNYWLFGLDYPTRPAENTLMEIDHTMYKRRPLTRILTLEMQSDPDYRADLTLWRGVRRASLELPPDFNPRTIALAEQWKQDLVEPEAIIRRALQMFNQEGFEYSYNPPPLGRDSMDDFLFETRSGYCEFYSSAFTVLMRAAGVPARVVTGYQGGYINDDADYVLVRQSDAHAWSEVWLEGEGWVRVDPTSAVAPDRVDLGALATLNGRRGFFDFEWMRALKNQFDAIQRFWNQSVVKFDSARQRALLSPLGIDDLSPSRSVIIMVVLSSLIIAIALWRLIRQQEHGHMDRVMQIYADFCKGMKRRGVSPSESEGPRDFAARCKQKLPDIADQIDQITDRYVMLRYAGNDNRQLENSFRLAVRSLK